MCARDMGRRGAPARAPRPGHAAPPASRVPRARAAQTSALWRAHAVCRLHAPSRHAHGARRTAHGHVNGHAPPTRGGRCVS